MFNIFGGNIDILFMEIISGKTVCFEYGKCIVINFLNTVYFWTINKIVRAAQGIVYT